MDTTIQEFVVENTTIEVEAEYFLESDYGADADGNRGVALYFINDIKYTIPDKDDTGRLLTEDDKHEIKVDLERMIQTTEWEFNYD